MTKSETVSIIIPVYNSQDSLPACLESVAGQSYENLQIIAINDGSSDDSGSICDDFAQKDARFEVIHKENGGIASAQNAGLDLATGEYIAFADNDDILDRRNIEILLSALKQTGADMSKGRWQQFGQSQHRQIVEKAGKGEENPGSIMKFAQPLRAYQTVFCKALRLAADRAGRHGEVRYFNEANWCRIYRRKLWEGLRFPEGMYAQDVMVAGRLYDRMKFVADVDKVLYYWRQSEDSVTHKERSFSFYHDNATAGIENMKFALQRGIMPARSWYTVAGAVSEEKTASDFSKPENLEIYRKDCEEKEKLFAGLTPSQRAKCSVLRQIRLAEKFVYDRKIKNMK